MKNNYYFNHVKSCLTDAFDLYYDLTFGFYNLESHQEKKVLDLSKVVKNEVYQKGGKFYDFFLKIGELEKLIYEFENEVNENSKNFDIDKSIAVQISDYYACAMRGISEIMFMYGVTYGKNLERYLNDFQDVLYEEKNI